MYLGFLDNGKISKMIYDSTSPGRVASSSDAEVMRKLLKGTVKGVCRDLARADNVLLDYFGIKSWTIVYANHEICVTSSLASERAYGEDEERIWLFNNGKVSSSTTNKYRISVGKTVEWDKLIKQTMGKYYPFK